MLPKRCLGGEGLVASVQGLGCMGMSGFYGAYDEEKSREESKKVITRASELGVTMLDTSDMYGPFTNEKLIGSVIKENREKYIIATKFGVIVKKDGMGLDSSYEYVKKACSASLERLGIDCIDLYYQHRYDPNTPIEETMRALKELKEEGKIKYIGLSETPIEEIRKAHSICPISAYQIEWSLFSREVEEKLIPLLRELGIGIVAYSPLGRGLLTGSIKSTSDLSDSDWRKNNPRFSTDNLDKNMELVKIIEKIAKKKKCTTGQIALAWVHQQGDDVFPIPGTKKVKYLEQNVEAFNIKLNDQELKELDFKDKVQGTRYHEAAMKMTFDGRK